MALMKGGGNIEKKDVGDRIRAATEIGSDLTTDELKRYSIYIPVKHMETLEMIAKERGLKKADMVRLSIREFLERN